MLFSRWTLDIVGGIEKVPATFAEIIFDGNFDMPHCVTDIKQSSSIPKREQNIEKVSLSFHGGQYSFQKATEKNSTTL